MGRSWCFYSRKAAGARCAAIALSALMLTACSEVRWALPGGAGALRADAGDVTGALGKPASAVVPDRPARLADADWTVAQQAVRDAVDHGSTDAMPWINPETGTMGTVALRSELSGKEGCAGFDLTVLKGESAERMTGQACRSPAGELRVEGLQAYTGS